MAKKRVEVEEPEMNVEDIQDNPVEKEEVKASKNKEEEPINCLRDEMIVVKFVPNPTAMIHSKGHILSGGMADNATRSFVVPRLSTGQFVNVLTNNEKACLEKAMGLEYNALSVYRRQDNFWDDSNPKGIGKVVLRKQNNYFDLKDPADYIRVKVLLANKDYIASSLQELEDRPKATYQFVVVSENAEAQMNLSKNEAVMECYVEYGAIRNDKDTLRVVLEILTGRPLGSNTKLDFLQGKVMENIEKDPRHFLRVIKDELLPAKVLIKKAVENGIITRRNDLYYYESTPMCEMGEESTLTNAAKYITNIRRKELKYTLEAKLKVD